MAKVIIVILRALAHLPWCVLYAISDVVCCLLHHVIGYRRKVVRTNLRNAFPEKTEKERRRIERDFYHHLSDMFVEGIKLLHFSDEEIRRRVRFTNMDLVEKMAQDGRPFILFMGHMGNWEWVQSISLFCHHPLLLAALYKPAKSETANEIIETVRSRFPNERIPSQRALRTLLGLNARKKQFMVAFIADQRTASRDKAMMFMGQKSTYYTGGEDLGRHINSHMLYLDVIKTSRGHYDFTFKELDPLASKMTCPYPYTHAFMQLLEDNIRRQPECWMWSHNRWKNNHKIEVPVE